MGTVILSPNLYQKAAWQFALYPRDNGRWREYLGLSIMGEIGELANCRKKYIRAGDQSPDAFIGYREKIISECGDILWYLSALATEIGVEFRDMKSIAHEIYESAGDNLTNSEFQLMTILVRHGYNLAVDLGSGPVDAATKKELTRGAAWVIALLQDILVRYHVTLGEVMALNLEKLKARQDRDAIVNHERDSLT